MHTSGNSQSLPKSERLHLQRRIETLFASQESLFVYPYRVIYHIERSENPGCALLIHVAKKRFRHAVDRNRLKRLTREAYRLHKTPLWGIVRQLGLRVDLVFISVATEMPPSSKVFRAMRKIIEQLVESLPSASNHV